MSADLDRIKLLLDIADATGPTNRPSLKGLHDRAMLELEDLAGEATAEVAKIRMAKAKKEADDAARAKVDALAKTEVRRAPPPEVKDAEFNFNQTGRRI